VDKAAPERIAEAVLFLKENFADQSWTRKDIAEWAGTTPETVMRTLADFEEEGLIAQIGRKIEVRNKRALLDRANLKF
jgi:CRP-like cAMP-binding protein